VRCTFILVNGAGARIDRMTSTDEVPADPPRVFISYAQDSSDHVNAVIAFSGLLRSLGIDAHLDKWYDNDRRDWAEWATHQLASADYVVAIASPRFREWADGHNAGPEGRGPRFEGALMRNKMTQDQARWIRKILPVVLPCGHIEDIPEFLLPYSATHYLVSAVTREGIEDLLRVLTRQSRHPLPPLGPPQPLSAEAVIAPPPQPSKPAKAGNRVRVSKSKVTNVVGGDFNTYGQGDKR
jgi:hypothetical protein